MSAWVWNGLCPRPKNSPASESYDFRVLDMRRFGTMKKTCGAGVWVVVAALGFHSVTAQENKPQDPPPEGGNANQAVPAVTFPCPELAKLDAFTGTWNVVETHFDSLGKAIATVKGTEVISWQLDQYMLRRIYATATDSARFKAIGFITWNEQAKHYTGHWFDNRSLFGPALAKGEWQEEGRSMTFTLDAHAPGGTKTQYKVIERFEDDDHRISTTYQMSGKDLTKRLEVRYERVAPCPANQAMRVISYPQNE